MRTAAKGLLSRTIRESRSRLLAELRLPPELGDAHDGPAWIKQAAFTLVLRLVILRLVEASDTRACERGESWWQRARQGDDPRGTLALAFAELALDLPGLFAGEGPAEQVVVSDSTLRRVVEQLDRPELEACWTDDLTLGWVFQFWNDPDREALDGKLAAGGKLEAGEIASKTQMFTERTMIEWLLHNSLGPLWLGICARNGWTPACEREGTLARLESQRATWRAKRAAGEVAPEACMPLEDDEARRWAFYVPQPAMDEPLPTSVRTLRILDPACGSGHFLVIAFELLVGLYREEARHRGEHWSDAEIVDAIVSCNLHGLDLDPLAVQVCAAALWLAARRRAPGWSPRAMNLAAMRLRLGVSDRAALGEALERELGSQPGASSAFVRVLAGLDHIGSLVRVEPALERLLAASSGSSDPETRERALGVLERWLGERDEGDALGVRLREGPHAAAIHVLRMLRAGIYDLVIGNPPYQGTARLADAGYVKAEYPRGKADLYAAFLERGLELAKPGGLSAMLTLRNWMFIRQYAGLRAWLLEGHELRVLADFDRGAFEAISDERVSVAASVFRRGRASGACVAMQPTPREDTSRDLERTRRKWAATLCQVGRHEFDVAVLRALPGWPLVYWWSPAFVDACVRGPTLGSVARVLTGLTTQNNARFVRRPHEVHQRDIFLSRTEPATWPEHAWVPYIKGGAGAKWQEGVEHVVAWGPRALALRCWLEFYAESKPGGFFKNSDHYFRIGCAVAAIGSEFGARVHRYASVFGHMGTSVFGVPPHEVVFRLNAGRTRDFVGSLNPTLHFGVSDIERIPWEPDSQEADSQEPDSEAEKTENTHARIDMAFGLHESHRETSVEYCGPGTSPWAQIQTWAQAVADRTVGLAPPPPVERLSAGPSVDHISCALGVALGRFSTRGGIRDAHTDAFADALPEGVMFLDVVTEQDDLAQPACAPLHSAWQECAPQASRSNLRDYLRLDFFPNVHRPMYENRPIHWPLSSARRSYVAYVTIHRWHAGTLPWLLGQRLHPAVLRLTQRIEQARSIGCVSQTDRRGLAQLEAALVELREFIERVTCCAERGPPPPTPNCPPRERDAIYAPCLEDGVKVNASALWPLLVPQWKDPQRWWQSLACANSHEDYDWSQLAGRYFPSRVAEKCRRDPSLAFAHRCLWIHHPQRAHDWEQRLGSELGREFTIDESESESARAAHLAAKSG